MKHLKRQQGSVLPLVIGLVVVLAVVVGVAVTQAQKAKTKQSTSSPSPTATATPVARTSTSPTATPAPSNEFKVTELGFKMTPPAGLTVADLKYVARGNSDSSFSTTSLEQTAGAGSQCSTANASIGSIVRSTTDPKTTSTGIAASKKVGNFYLGFITPQSPCSNNSTAEQLQMSQALLLRRAFDSATAL